MKTTRRTPESRPSGRIYRYREISKQIFSVVLITATCLSWSCKKDNDPGVPTGNGPDENVYEYFEFNPSSATHMNFTVVDESQYHYQIVSTEHDPYVSSRPLKVNNPSDRVVLTFEYYTSQTIQNVQLYFADPLSEARSVRGFVIPASETWATCSFIIEEPIYDFNWGKAGNYIRFDPGDDAGITLNFRKMHLREMTPEEEEEYNKPKRDEESLKAYLSASFTSNVTRVDVGATTVSITGNYTGEGSYSLAEIPPYVNVALDDNFEYKTSLTSSSFTVSLDRYVERGDIVYDRLLSKWAIVKDGTKDELVSHARYADNIESTQNLAPAQMTSKKGLGGIFGHDYQMQDLYDLDITSGTINLTIAAFMYTQQSGNRIEHQYGGKTYYFERGPINDLDNVIRRTHEKGVVLSGIILIQPYVSDPVISELLRHPKFDGRSPYTMPNMTTPESVEAYGAALDFLASRYCRADAEYGRIHHWILHNEVDMGVEWTNMGVSPITVYMDTYIKSMKMCYNIARKYDPNSEVLASFTHSWTSAVGAEGHPTKEMIDILNAYTRAEGDYKWGLACHPYPQDLTNPRTWEDNRANYTMSTPLVTFKNLEVLDYWAKQPANQYMGSIKRSVWLSENGTNSPSYSEADLKLQAAGFAWAWKKIKALDGIDGIQWHNWFDHPDEGGLRIGLRMLPDYGLEKKPVWFAYQAAGTADEDAVFEPYLSVIGIPDWNIIQTVSVPDYL